MAGGTFVKGVEKVRPGAYFNFESQKSGKVYLSERGTVVIPLVGYDYGPRGKFISIHCTEQEKHFPELGRKTIDIMPVREAFKSAKEVIVYILGNSEAKAKATIGTFTATAKYPGARGNKFKLVVLDNPLETGTFDVKLYLESDLVYKVEKISDVSQLPANQFVDFTGTGKLTANAGVEFTGGIDSVATNNEVVTFLDGLETQIFNAVSFPFIDSTLIGAFDSKIKYLVNEIGKQVIGVRPKQDIPGDSEFIITMVNGVELPNAKLSSSDVCHWFAAATASAQVFQSLTHVGYPGAIDANPRIGHTDTVSALKKGGLVFTYDKDKGAIVEQDINSFTSFTPKKNKAYSKNRVIRTLQEIAITGSLILKPNKYDGNADGYALVKEDLNKMLLALQSLNALKNVNVDEDIVFDMTLTGGDECYPDIYVQPVDSIEKFYVTVKTS